MSGIPRVIHGSATGAIGRDCGVVEIKVRTPLGEGSSQLKQRVEKLSVATGDLACRRLWWSVGDGVVEAGSVRRTVPESG